MADILFHAHFGLRYLVLLAGLAALIVSAVGAITRAPFRGAGVLLGRIFLGLLDLQVLIGIILLIVRDFYPALIGHIAMMLLAAVFAHAGSVMNRRRHEDARSHALQAGWVATALVLMVGGILAIGRSIV